MDPRAPQRLVDVDVPEPCHGSLVEQRCLDRGTTPLQALREPARVEAALEWFDPHLSRQVRLELARLEQEPRAEAPDVAIRNVRSVV